MIFIASMANNPGDEEMFINQYRSNSCRSLNQPRRRLAVLGVRWPG